MIGKKASKKDQILKMLTKRVLDLDLKRSLGEDIDLQEIALDHINALDEITSIDKSEIEKIADQIIKEYQEKQTPKQKLYQFFKKYSRELVIFLIASLLVLVIFLSFLLFRFSEPNNTSQNFDSPLTQPSETNRIFYVRSMLAQVVSQMTGVKMYFAEFYMAAGKMPNKFEDLKDIMLDLQDSPLIEKADITKSGELVVFLSDDFGEGKVVKLKSSTSRSGMNVKWVCETNLEKKFLGVSQAAFCTYNEDILSD